MKSRTKLVWLLVIGTVFMVCLAATTQQEERKIGPETLVLEGGRTGNISFPHRRHQTALDQKCEVCHDLFPQKLGSIQELKEEGKLKSKEIMNKHCVKCHREMKREGKPTGPVSCTQCHDKD